MASGFAQRRSRTRSAFVLIGAVAATFALVVGNASAVAAADITREQLVQVIPDDLPNPDDRNIVCKGADGVFETADDYAYFFVSGIFVADSVEKYVPSADNWTRFSTTTSNWQFDGTAVRSDDLILDPDELDGPFYTFEAKNVRFTSVVTDDGTQRNTARAKGDVIELGTGDVVDRVDFYEFGLEGMEPTVVYSRGNCG